jgi:polynucleotide 5'-hydroxyl-kinase GRC3/NOL9
MDLFATVARVAERGGVVMALGGLDSGKSTFCTLCAEVAVRLGRPVGYLDTDIGQKTVGPPATIGLKYVNTEADLAPEALARADIVAFVGAVSPADHELGMVIGAMKLATQARAAGVHLIVVDTTGFIEGTQGLVLKLAKVEALRPDFVIGFQRGGELEPILGAIRRISPPEVDGVSVDPKILPTTLDQRSARRSERLRAVFRPPVYSWSVKPSVIVPALPPDTDPAVLDRMLVGMEDGKGACIGLGILEARPDGLHMVSAIDQGAKALRLGSLRVTPDFGLTRVDLRDIFYD